MTGKEFYEFGPFRLEPTERRIFKDAGVISLPPKEFDLLLALVAAGGGLCTGEQLYRRVWGAETFVEPQNVQVHISNVRTALGDSKGGQYKYIENVRGTSGGYRLIPPVKHHRAGEPKRMRSLIFAGLGLAALIVSGAALVWRSGRPPSVSEERRLFALALQYEQQGDDEEALRALDKSIAANPRFSEAYLEAAQICNDLEQDDKTQKYLTGAKDLAGTQGEAFQLKVRALSLEAEGQQDEAMKEYQILVDRFPSDMDGKSHLADLALELERLEDADRALKECLAAEPRNPYCNLDSMVLMLLRNDFDGVLNRYRDLTSQRVRYPWFHSVVGAALLGKEDVQGATQEFEILESVAKKLHGNVHFRAGKEWLAGAALYTGNLETATGQINLALETSDSPEERAGDLIYLARAQLLVGDENAAKSSAIKAVGTSSSPLTYIGAARVLAAVGDKSASDRILSGHMPNGEAIEGVGPGNLHFMKGVFALNRGSLAEAITELKNSYDIDDDLFTAFVLGQAYRRFGQNDLASDLFKRVIDEKGEVLWNEVPSLWPLAHYELGNCYVGLGEIEKAKSTYSEFLTLWSNADPKLTQVRTARQALARIEPPRSHGINARRGLRLRSCCAQFAGQTESHNVGRKSLAQRFSAGKGS